jgi:YVTN family beta-propeller protein
MRTTRTIRSCIVIAALSSTLLAQNARTSIDGTVSRLYDPPAFYTSAIVNGLLTIQVVRFSSFGTKVVVTPILAIRPASPNAPSSGAGTKPRRTAMGQQPPDPDDIDIIPLPDPPFPDPWDDIPLPDPPIFPDPFDDIPLPDPPFPDPPDDPMLDLPDPNPFPDESLMTTDFPNDSVDVVQTGGSASNGAGREAASITSIPVGHNPAAIAAIPDHSGALVTNNGSGTVSVIQGNSVVATIPIPGGMPDGIAITPDSLHAYVTNFDNLSPSVSVIDIPGRKVITTLTAGPYPAVVAITPDGSQAWVTSIFGSGLEIIDTATNTIVGSLAGIPGAWGITFNPTGTRAYVAASNSGAVYVLDTTSYKTLAVIQVGSSPRHVAVSPSGRFVFVTNTQSDFITQIDARTNTVVRNITVGQRPLGIRFVSK